MSPEPTTIRPVLQRDSASPLRLVGRVVTRPVRVLAFWLAVVLPLLTLAFLATGVEFTSLTDLLTLASLLMANVAALVVGHGHRRD